MRPVLKCCFLALYVPLSASVSANVPALKCPFLKRYREQREFRGRLFNIIISDKQRRLNFF